MLIGRGLPQPPAGLGLIDEKVGTSLMPRDNSFGGLKFEDGTLFLCFIQFFMMENSDFFRFLDVIEFGVEQVPVTPDLIDAFVTPDERGPRLSPRFNLSPDTLQRPRGEFIGRNTQYPTPS